MTKREAIAMFLSTLLSIIVTLLFWIFALKAPLTIEALYNVTTTSTGIIVSVASASLALGVTGANLLVKINDAVEGLSIRTKARNEEVDRRLGHIQDIFQVANNTSIYIREHGEHVDSRLSQIEESIREMQASTRGLHNSAIEDVRAGIGKLKKPVRKASAKIVQDFENTISLSNSGVRVEGCEWALRAYQTVWEHLVEEQRRIQKEGKDPIIARITHSNEISVWNHEGGSVIESLYILQKAFVDFGGIIYRVLIKEKSADRTPYEEVKVRMETAGVSVYIVDKSNYEAEFDFLLVHDDTNEIGGDVVVKWLTGANGGKLAAAEVEDAITDVVRRHWRLVCGMIEGQNLGKEVFERIPFTRRIV